MSYVKDKGYVRGPRDIITAKVANTDTIAVNDIVQLDAVGGATGSGYITSYQSKAGAFVGVALEAVTTAPTNDGDVSIKVVRAQPSTIFCFDATGISQADCWGLCDINGEQSVDVTTSNYCNFWIVEVDTDNSLAYGVIMGPFQETTTSSVPDYGTA